jgi:lipoprotein NlpD
MGGCNCLLDMDFFSLLHRRVGLTAALLGLVVVAACSTRPVGRAPVEDRAPVVTGRPAAAPAATLPGAATGLPPAAAQAPAAAAGGPPVDVPAGSYVVRPGDTLIRIGLDTGQNWRDIQRWNGLENPNRIEVGQVLRVVPPSASAPTVVAAPTTAAAASAASPSPTDGSAPTRPVTSAIATPAVSAVPQGLPPAGTAQPASPAPVATAPASATVSATPASSAPPTAGAGVDDDINFVWPAAGTVVAAFDEARNKGLGIGGRAGDPVMAAADGRVVYAGAGLRGYGNLVILKHNNTFLTAYAHNQTLLVREDQTVRRGQKIAEMGSTDTDRVKLHFEIRRQGKPVDPVRYLPSR